MLLSFEVTTLWQDTNVHIIIVFSCCCCCSFCSCCSRTHGPYVSTLERGL